jgi:molybdopterin/thiamine biosynthesis adenylyltransferase
MGLIAWLQRRGEAPPPPAPSRAVEVRISGPLFERVRAHVEDFSQGEESGFLLCGIARLQERDVLLARAWRPIPDALASRFGEGSVLSWPASFNSDVLAEAVEIDCTPVLVHSHGAGAPRFSDDDRRRERGIFPTFSRILGPTPTGSIVLGEGRAAGSFWLGGEYTPEFSRLVIVGNTIEDWAASASAGASAPVRRRLDRQSRAIGPRSEQKLAEAKVAVFGLSGGGSHVVQQLAHQGVGTLIVVDDDRVDQTNLGRLVGATHADVDRTLKVDLAERVATGVDPGITVVKVSERFPTAASIAAVKEADIVVACVDRFDVREAINALARRHLLPLVDVGMTIRSSGERLVAANGQVIVALPGHPCMRCWFLTDAVLATERRDRPAGYDANPDAEGDPQVVSMNGVLASEACNVVLDLITGYSGGRRGARYWQYDGRSGQLDVDDVPTARPGCPACAEEGHGDPLAV